MGDLTHNAIALGSLQGIVGNLSVLSQIVSGSIALSKIRKPEAEDTRMIVAPGTRGYGDRGHDNAELFPKSFP